MVTKIVSQPHQFIFGHFYFLHTIGHDALEDIPVNLQTIDNISNQWTVAGAFLVVEAIAAIIIAKLLVCPSMDEFATIVAVFLF
jgi:hypothetical protein